MNAAIHLESFNTWICWAQQDLRFLPSEDTPRSRAVVLKMVLHPLNHALQAANKLGCPARKAMCLRVMNWIAADLRRLPA